MAATKQWIKKGLCGLNPKLNANNTVNVVWWWKLFNENTHIFQGEKLIIENLDKFKDSGKYKCTVITNGSTSTEDTLDVTILGENANKLNH